jgi:biotin transport system substrate-specific component
VLADLAPGRTLTLPAVRDLALIGGAASLVGLLAQLVIHVPGSPVPITGQSLGVLVSGSALGWRRGTAAMLIYAGAGFAGVPWFASHQHGWSFPAAGYLFGFVLAAYICGSLAERGGDRRILSSLPSLVVSDLAIYLVGVPWLAFSLHPHLSLAAAVREGFNPFVIGDSIKVAVGACALPAAWRLAKSRQ